MSTDKSNGNFSKCYLWWNIAVHFC